MEELKRNASVLKHFVQWCEDNISHARVHLPEQGSARGEEHAQGPTKAHSCRVTRTAIISVFIGERKVVRASEQCRVERTLGRAVQPQPFAHIVVVDRVKSTRISDKSEPQHA